MRILDLPSKFGSILRSAILPILVFVFFLSWVWYRGVPLNDSIRLAVVVGIQIAAGVLIWRRLCWRLDPSTLESLGMGLAIGTAAATISDQLFLNTFLQSVAWLLPLIFVVLFSLVKPLQIRESPIESLNVRVIFVLSAAVVLGFGTLRHGFGVLIIGFVIGYLISREKTVRFQAVTYVVSLIVGFLVLLALRPTVQYGSWRMRPLYTGTDDLVFSESLSQSLSHFGIFEHSAAVGVHLRYHWFSLAWSGLTSRVAGSEPFDVTLHVVPFIAFLGIAALVWTISFRLTKSIIASNISILVLFCANSLPENIRFFYVSNTSNTLSYIWVLAAILIFFYAIETQYKSWLVVFPAMLAISLLAKMPYGAVLLTATSGALIYAIVRVSPLRTFATIMLLASTLSSFTIYLLFIKLNSWHNFSPKFTLETFNFTQSTLLTISLSFLFLGAILFVRFPFSLEIIDNNQSQKDKIFLLFLGVGSLSGIVRFIVDWNLVEDYFLNASLIFGAFLTSYSFNLLAKTTGRMQLFTTQLVYLCSACSAFVVFGIVYAFNYNTDFPFGTNGEILVAPIIAFAVSIIFSLGQRMRSLDSRITFTFMLFCSLIGVSSGIFVFQSIREDTYRFTESVASTTDLQSLDWVRSNVEKEDILATNRFLCNQETPCTFDDSSFLISAVSRRRVLIEGTRFVAGLRPYPNWAKDRIQKSIDFANSPSEKSWSQLKFFEVGWFYLDTNFVTPDLDISNNTWGPWATVAYHNSNV